MSRFVQTPSALTHRLIDTHNFALVAADRLEQLAVPVEAMHTGYGVLKDSASLLPVVIDLKALTPQDKQQLLAQLLEGESLQHSQTADPHTMEPPVLATLVQSQATAGILARHLGTVQLLHAKQQEKGWLRVHDGRVMSQVGRIVNDLQWQGLLGPVNTWTCFAYGYWLSAQNPCTTGTAATVALRPDGPTLHALERIGVINRTLPLVSCTGWGDVLAWSPVLGGYAQAAKDQYSITKATDLAEYARLCVQIHPQFDKHPAVRKLIQDHMTVLNNGQPQDKEEPLMDVITGQGPGFWQQVKADLHQEKSKEQL